MEYPCLRPQAAKLTANRRSILWVPLTDEMISEWPKLASASCDNWMAMHASNSCVVCWEKRGEGGMGSSGDGGDGGRNRGLYHTGTRILADSDLPCVFPLVKGGKGQP
uniref:Uncharacterized protein n=1 Tax=Vespula pensylvanica TaxID=30213 RepID=A0A834P881_VESPE|nr:hypothetical protein H0235_004828 [Vespula pensylvanica]